jgi:hypothetical protein
MFYLSQILPGAFVIHGFVTGLTRRVPLVELEMLTLPEHLRSLPVFSGVCVTRSLVKPQTAGHIILFPNQPVCALSPECCSFSGEATNASFIVFGLTQSELDPTIQ